MYGISNMRIFMEMINELANDILLKLKECVNDPENCSDKLDWCTKMARVLSIVGKTLETNQKLHDAQIDEEQEALDLKDKSTEESIQILEGMLNYHKHRLPSCELLKEA